MMRLCASSEKNYMTTTPFQFSIKKFLLGLFAGISSVAILTVACVFLWGDKFLEVINYLYLKF